MEQYQTYAFDAVVVGTGAAGYNAACRIMADGRKSVALVTEGINTGTSRNTGSDKQTYYKLGLGGDSPDSVRTMAENLFAGGSVDGDNALCEAALSTRCFLHLAELGVPFPTNRYGEYVGYKTDHDPYARATSAGPLTSKFMTEAPQKEAARLQVPIFDNLLAVEILKDENGVCGLVCLDKQAGRFQVFRCGSVVLATGGPAGIYADSVYPHCHTGSTGLALDAGVSLQNMTEWQFGLASVNPRWNVSGTYMQVLPRFISVGEDETPREFLSDFFSDPYEALDAVFLKGYQWPFDSKKVMEGSSVIDLLVYRESVLKKRRVYLDYTQNPFGMTEIDYAKLAPETREYLQKAGACFGTPIERLEKMNRPAIALYRSKDLDITRQPLEIALCAQHNNGGIAVDLWWQTDLPGLFAAGECAGTHGISRPGGSALNAGQVGSLRAAQFICAGKRSCMDTTDFQTVADSAVTRHRAFCEAILKNENNVTSAIQAAQRRMSDCGGAIRDCSRIEQVMALVLAELQNLENCIGVLDNANLYRAYKLKDLLTVQYAVLGAMADFRNTIGTTRGSALYQDRAGTLRTGLEELFRFRQETGGADRIQQVRIENGKLQIAWRPVRPLPTGDDFFENIWRQYRENQNIY